METKIAEMVFAIILTFDSISESKTFFERRLLCLVQVITVVIQAVGVIRIVQVIHRVAGVTPAVRVIQQAVGVIQVV